MYRFYSSPTNSSRVSVVGEHQNGVLKIAVSRCSEKDNFIRKKGRAIAEGRLLKGKTFTEVPIEDCSSSDFVAVALQVAEEVLATKNVY